VNYQQLAEEFVLTVKSMNKSSFMMDLNRYSKGEMLVLNYLFKHQEESTVPSDLRNYTKTSSARIAAILGSLDAQGYITREIDRRDRRKILVSLTEQGRSVACAYHNAMLNRLASVFEHMGQAESQAFIERLKDFVEAGKIINSQQEDQSQEIERER
jgi:DNA-binding MarR family transcriptional regulator